MFRGRWLYGVMFLVVSVVADTALAQGDRVVERCDRTNETTLTEDYKFPRFGGVATRPATFRPDRIDGNYELDVGGIASKTLPAGLHSRTVINVTNMLTDFHWTAS